MSTSLHCRICVNRTNCSSYSRGLSFLLLSTIWGVEMKIMIVEDHPDMRRMLKSIVSIAAHGPVEVFECADGDEAIRTYNAEHPDRVLMDIQLGSTDGFTVTERIREQHPDASVIFVSSHNTSAYRTKAKLLHARGFVSKENLSELDSLLQ